MLASILASSHPYILKFLCTWLYPQVLHPYVIFPRLWCLLVSSHSHILIASGTYVLVGILASFHPRILIYSDSCVFGCILASSHPYVIFPGLYVFTCILPSSHPCTVRFVRTCWYPCIVISSDSYVFPFVLASSYPQIHVCFLLSLHLVIVIFFIYNTDLHFANKHLHKYT